jgi:hypothetical protein
MGAAGLEPTAIELLTELSVRVLEESQLHDEEREARLCHLGVSRWLLGSGGADAAAWPLYFRTTSTVADAVAGGSDRERLREAWRRFGEVLGVSTVADLEAKCELLRHLGARGRSASERSGQFRRGPIERHRAEGRGCPL